MAPGAHRDENGPARIKSVQAALTSNRLRFQTPFHFLIQDPGLTRSPAGLMCPRNPDPPAQNLPTFSPALRAATLATGRSRMESSVISSCLRSSDAYFPSYPVRIRSIMWHQITNASLSAAARPRAHATHIPLLVCSPAHAPRSQSLSHTCHGEQHVGNYTVIATRQKSFPDTHSGFSGPRPLPSRRLPPANWPAQQHPSRQCAGQLSQPQGWRLPDAACTRRLA